jgi:hypothetical protein
MTWGGAESSIMLDGDGDGAAELLVGVFALFLLVKKGVMPSLCGGTMRGLDGCYVACL